jgi:hypothetical protein
VIRAMANAADIHTSPGTAIEVRSGAGTVVVFAAEGARADDVVVAMRARLGDSTRVDELAAAWRAGASAAGDAIHSAAIAFIRGASATIIHAGDLSIHGVGPQGSQRLVQPHTKLDDGAPLRIRSRGLGLPGPASRAALTETRLDGLTSLVLASVSVWAPLGDAFDELLAMKTAASLIVARAIELATPLARATARAGHACAIIELPDRAARTESIEVAVAAQRNARRAIRTVLSRSVGARAAVVIAARGTGKTTVLQQLGRAGMVDASASMMTASQLRRVLKSHAAAGLVVVDRLLDVIGDDASLGLALSEAIDQRRLSIVSSATPSDFAAINAVHKRLATQLASIELGAPTRDELLDVVRAWAPRFAEQHHVELTSDAIEAAVALTERFSLGRAQPEAALFALEQACLRAGHAGIVTGTLTDRGGGIADHRSVAAAIADLQGVPIEVIDGNEHARISELGARLGARLHGQRDATTCVAAALQRGLERRATTAQRRPLASFLLLGATGTGKSETARLLAEYWFADRHALTAIDLSEYGEPSSVYRLTGAPPGHIGYGERPQLAAALAANGHRVILFDELEKACTEVQLLLLQILDEGRLTTSQGETLDFSSAMIVLTSNLDLGDHAVGFGGARTEASDEQLRKRLTKILRPELVARIDEVVVYQPITNESALSIALGHLGRCTEALVASGRLKPLELPALRGRVLGQLAQLSDHRGGARHILRTVERVLAEQQRPAPPSTDPIVVYPYLDGGRERLAAGFLLDLAAGADANDTVNLILTHPAGTSLLYVAHDRARILVLVGDEATALEIATATSNAGRARSATGRVRADVSGRPVGELIDQLFS